MSFDETTISAAIVDRYHAKLRDRLISDVLIVGAGPSGLLAAKDLSQAGFTVTVIEKRLAPGGGIWGGAMAMNELVLPSDVAPILDELSVRSQQISGALLSADAVELASALTMHAVQSGAVLLNMTEAEDIALYDQHVSGVVINRTGLTAQQPIDPLTLRAPVIVDATGHDAAIVKMLTRRDLLHHTPRAGEGPMNAEQGERFVVERTGQLYPGLWVCGMAVCATYGGPRMGPIFGGMLQSGRRLAEQVNTDLTSR
jgi:thiamine thiazole synthase